MVGMYCIREEAIFNFKKIIKINLVYKILLLKQVLNNKINNSLK